MMCVGATRQMLGMSIPQHCRTHHWNRIINKKLKQYLQDDTTCNQFSDEHVGVLELATRRSTTVFMASLEGFFLALGLHNLESGTPISSASYKLLERLGVLMDAQTSLQPLHDRIQ
jgi:hypothetical protein